MLFNETNMFFGVPRKHSIAVTLATVVGASILAILASEPCLRYHRKQRYVGWVRRVDELLLAIAGEASETGMTYAPGPCEVFGGYGKLPIPGAVDGVLWLWRVRIDVQPNSPQVFSAYTPLVIRLYANPEVPFRDLGLIQTLDDIDRVALIALGDIHDTMDHMMVRVALIFLLKSCMKMHVRPHRIDVYVRSFDLDRMFVTFSRLMSAARQIENPL